MELIGNRIITDKIPNELDLFVLKFLKILCKYTDYIIISGYVSILLGRSRATEDIDLFIKPLKKEVFSRFYHELMQNNFWCINTENENEILSYLEDRLAVRFAETNTHAPNFEIKYPKDELDEEAFDNYLSVVLKTGEIKISSLERQIAFKRYYLSSDKDVADALHIEELFKSKIDNEKVNKYKELIRLKRK
ncbi:nucleotidyltransferase [Candidatus Pacearchaeota archaeon]|nr:nucleotidyltransferase [Candidatus Pacearchaeota archaeon]